MKQDNELAAKLHVHRSSGSSTYRPPIQKPGSSYYALRYLPSPLKFDVD